MNFEQIKTAVLYKDGSLRDILIRDTSRTSYEELCSLLRREGIRYEIEVDGQPAGIEGLIAEFDKGDERRHGIIRFFVRGICFVTHSFSETEIEIDFMPNDVGSSEDWQRVVDLLLKLGTHYRQQISVYAEGECEKPLFTAPVHAAAVNGRHGGRP
jgi:hypothetical protein